MDIPKIGVTGNVDHGGDRPKRTESKRDYVIPSVVRDEARISSSSRETAAAIVGLTERARQGDGDRSAKVAAAREKLLAGELDTPAAQRETAQRLLATNFASI